MRKLIFSVLLVSALFVGAETVTNSVVTVTTNAITVVIPPHKGASGYLSLWNNGPDKIWAEDNNVSVSTNVSIAIGANRGYTFPGNPDKKKVTMKTATGTAVVDVSFEN